ncbi:MAG: hypothetical protein HRT71_17015 [Flavobacteriales bacterium]|nr:hypothetical protein [Flavobacteriales bacterium]
MRSIFIIILSLFIFTGTQGQVNSVASVFTSKYGILKTQVIGFTEIDLEAEILISTTRTYTMQIGYIYSADFFTKNNGLYLGTSYFNKGFLASFGIKQYNSSSSLIYWELKASYRYKMFNDKLLTYSNQGVNGIPSIVLSQQKHVLNAKLLRGRMWVKNKLITEVFAGVGFDLSYIKSYFGTEDLPCEPCNVSRNSGKKVITKDNGIYLMPSVHVGLKLGAAIKKK